MTSSLKTLLIMLAFLPVGIYLGNQIGSDEIIAPVAVIAVLLLCLVIGGFFRKQRMECLVLSFILAGNIIGNRGFAELSIVKPFYVGEICIATIGLLMAIRYLVTREPVSLNHPIGLVIIAYLACGVARCAFNVRTYQLDALRDLAIVYYSVFFFAAYNLALREDSARFLDTVLVWTFGLQSIVAVLLLKWPEALDGLEVRGMPLLTQKNDLTSSFAAMGILFLWLRRDVARPGWLRCLIILALMICLTFTLARAAVAALMLALVLPLIAAPLKILFYPALIVSGGIILLFSVGAVTDNDRITDTQEKLISMVDISHSYHYQTGIGDEKGADNDFRRELWRSIFNQTIENNDWVIGKGFGYDFITRFEEEYGRGHWESLRSAHNYYVTVFGRMGLLGLSILLAITVMVIRGGIKAAGLVRRGEVRNNEALSYWSCTWVILVAGSLGVVMEGPMGAIPFWSFLGMACASDMRERARRKPPEEPIELPERVEHVWAGSLAGFGH